MDREGDGLLSSKVCGRQVRLQSQVVANRDHMSWKPIWIECAWRRVLVHILTFRLFGRALVLRELLRHELRRGASGMAKRNRTCVREGL